MPKDFLKKLTGMLAGGRPEVLHEAVEALVAQGRKEASTGMATVKGALKSEDALVQWAAAVAVGDLNDKAAIPDLKEALNNTDIRIRVVVSQSLLRLQDASGVPKLIAALTSDEVMIGHPPQLVGTYASWVLESATGQRFGVDREKWREWWESKGARFCREAGYAPLPGRSRTRT